MEGLLAVVCLDNVQRIPVLDGHVLQSLADLLGEFILGIPDLLWHTAAEVISKGSVHHCGEGHLAQSPYRPCPLCRGEEFRVGVDMPCMGMKVTAVKGFINLGLQVLVIDLSDPVEVRQLHVDVVDDFGFRRRLGKKDGSAAAECLCVELMGGDERKDMLQHRLLASIVRYRCSHIV